MENTIIDTATVLESLPFGMKMARKLWRKEPNRKRVTACYMEGSTIIVGTNDFKTDPQARRYGHKHDRTHAELAVLKNISDGSNGKLFVYREKADGTVGMARPCEFCMKMLKEKNIKKIVYTTNDGISREAIFQ